MAQRFDVPFDLTQSHTIQNATCVEILLGKKTDVFDAGFPGGFFHLGCQGRAVVLFQQVPKTLAAAFALPAFAALGLRGGATLRAFGFVLRSAEVVTFEIKLERFVVGGFFLGGFRQDQTQSVFQDVAVREADHLHGACGVDPLGRRDAQTRASGDLEEAA